MKYLTYDAIIQRKQNDLQQKLKEEEEKQKAEEEKRQLASDSQFALKIKDISPEVDDHIILHNREVKKFKVYRNPSDWKRYNATFKDKNGNLRDVTTQEIIEIVTKDKVPNDVISMIVQGYEINLEQPPVHAVYTTWNQFNCSGLNSSHRFTATFMLITNHSKREQMVYCEIDKSTSHEFLDTIYATFIFESVFVVITDRQGLSANQIYEKYACEPNTFIEEGASKSNSSCLKKAETTKQKNITKLISLLCDIVEKVHSNDMSELENFFKKIICNHFNLLLQLLTQSTQTISR